MKVDHLFEVLLGSDAEGLNLKRTHVHRSKLLIGVRREVVQARHELATLSHSQTKLLQIPRRE